MELVAKHIVQELFLRRVRLQSRRGPHLLSRDQTRIDKTPPFLPITQLNPLKMTDRSIRLFKQWMHTNSIDFSDALDFPISSSSSVAVTSICDLSVGDLIATIPKLACLTVRTSAASAAIDAAGLEGSLALAVAVMYERSLGEGSKWYGYLQLLPEREMVPLVWSEVEVDRLLKGTELHKTVKEDQAFVYEDWKEHIEPLIISAGFDPNHFGVKQYFSAKSLVSSRSFEVDDYHGYGMVPLADLFNHKTGAENVHFTNNSSHSDDSDNEGNSSHSTTSEEGNDPENSDDDIKNDDDPDNSDGDPESSDDDPTTLEMIVVKEVKAGNEVFNTYGIMGNAALLHRYGFTELDNTYDIVNIDLSIILQWSSSIFSDRHTKARLALFRSLNFSGCESEDSEYFEISFDGQPQIELAVLIYIIYLPDKTYEKLNRMNNSFSEDDEVAKLIMLAKICNIKCVEADNIEESFYTKDVGNALITLADIRESLYGENSLEDDEQKLKKCCPSKDRKQYNALVLRICERKILKKLRTHAMKYCGNKKRKHYCATSQAL